MIPRPAGPPRPATRFDILPRPGGGRPGAPAPLIEVLAEILLDGVVTLTRTALADGQFEPGEHLKVLYGLYSHQAIYEGGGSVIHLSKQAGRVERASLEAFRDGRCQIWVVDSPRRYPGEQVAARARSKLGARDYDLFQNNCEHFCNWCRSGAAVSRQVERWLP
jgi:hypothetical protein